MKFCNLTSVVIYRYNENVLNKNQIWMVLNCEQMSMHKSWASHELYGMNYNFLENHWRMQFKHQHHWTKTADILFAFWWCLEHHFVCVCLRFFCHQRFYFCYLWYWFNRSIILLLGKDWLGSIMSVNLTCNKNVWNFVRFSAEFWEQTLLSKCQRSLECLI